MLQDENWDQVSVHVIGINKSIEAHVAFWSVFVLKATNSLSF